MESTILRICEEFFDRLNRDGIRYCHWKSNIRLRKSLSGKTDLDILVHREDQNRFEKALESFQFKLILSPPEKQYPGLEDYLGFDNDTGRLVHLHVHYNLILGQRYIKNHHLPIEEMVLENLISRDNVRIPCPELELILLIIRAHMKLDVVSLLKQAVKDLIGTPYTPFPAHIEEELDDLIRASDGERLKVLLRQSGLPLPEDLFTRFIARYAARKLHVLAIIGDSCRIFSALKGFRRRTAVARYLAYAYRALWDLPGMSRFRPVSKKTLPGKGKVFALVGADGSGKSTLIEDLDRWLSWKLTVRRYYYGIPKHKAIEIVSRLAHGFRKLKLERPAAVLETGLWLFIARQRYMLSRRARRDAAHGEIVISDRFPLKSFHHMAEPMDGPRLKQQDGRRGSPWSDREGRYYDRILSPDRIFVLKVALEEVRRRKRDLDIETHRTKVEAVNAIGEDTLIRTIDANRPYYDVQLQVKRLIWEDL